MVNLTSSMSVRLRSWLVWSALCLGGLPGLASAGVFYDWNATDGGGATGFIEFAMPIATPGDFINIPVIAGEFDFDGLGALLSFDIFALPAPNGPLSNLATAALDIITVLDFRRVGGNNQLNLLAGDVNCGQVIGPGGPIATCGGPANGGATLSSIGSWTLRATGASEPGPLGLLALGLAGIYVTQRRRQAAKR